MVSWQKVLPLVTCHMAGGARPGGYAGGGGDGDGGDGEIAMLVVPQIVQPGLVTELSEYQVIVLDAAIWTLLGPVVSLYRVLPMVM